MNRETEQTSQPKKLWMKPELTVLVRHNSEEAVLTGWAGGICATSPTYNDNYCRDGLCGYCSGISSS